MNKTQAAELKQHEQERDFFCVVSDAFHVFAQRSAILLGSAGIRRGRARHPYLDPHRTDLSFLRHLATDH